MTEGGNRWRQGGGPRGESYDARFVQLAESGMDMHGEADFVESLAPATVLDAGCGTGRVAIELARRGLDVLGTDVDAMLSAARTKAPDLPWVLADLAAASFDLGRRFDVVVAAGNVMIFVAAGTEGAVLQNLARHLEPEGRLVAGFQLQPNGLSLERYDALASEAGLVLDQRYATWDRQPFSTPASYAVSVHRRATAAAPTAGDGRREVRR